MPLFYLNLYDDFVAEDEEGAEFADADAARLAAIDGARDLIAARIRRGEPVNLTHRIEVEDENRKCVHSVTFAQAVTFQEPDP